MSYLSQRKTILTIMFIYTLAWGAATILSAIILPKSNIILTWVIVSYIAVYFLFSLYRTLNPISTPCKE
ncbi:hypothetical protein IB691_01685 [Fangia hongkongensis]|nr:hypothetical protein [Fangia hongkongensis]